jgi:hypothetical protein
MIEKQKKQDGGCYVSTVLFDDESEVLHETVEPLLLYRQVDSYLEQLNKYHKYYEQEHEVSRVLNLKNSGRPERKLWEDAYHEEQER